MFAAVLLCLIAPAEIRALLDRMTAEEKLSLVHGARDPKGLGQAGYWPGVPRLGIPPLRFADGPPGVNVNAPATAMPAPVGLAATFDVEAARLYGMVLGREARALEQDVLLAPHINIVRDPLFRRNHTTFSEDPFLTARIAAAEIAGIQSQGVMAQVKHLAAYNGGDNVVVDERTLREIYLPAFEAAVKAGAASMMCAYNRINGDWACESQELQNQILRGAWGFRGFVTSDWGALRSPLAILKGVDLEMPGREIAGRPGPFFTDALQAAVERGSVPAAAIDEAAGRILRQMDRFHLLAWSLALDYTTAPSRSRLRISASEPRASASGMPDGTLEANAPARIDVEADARAVEQLAAEGAVLLKNDRDALPLTAADLHSLAVIGPTGGQLAAGYMGERAYGFESRLIAPLDALRKLAPRAHNTYSVGDDLTGVPIPGVPEAKALAPGAEYSWTGAFTAPVDGEYALMVQAVIASGAQGGGEIRVDGESAARSGAIGFLPGSGMVAKKWSSLLPTTDGRDNARGRLRLAAGPHRIEVSAVSSGEAPVDIRFAWTTPEQRRANIDAAAATARAARTAVVFAWNGAGSTLALPDEQDELIRRVAAANPRTIVVLNTGGPVAMPWRDSVRAILQMWYPGQEGGWATAKILLGVRNPSGRLPVTFPARLEDTPAHAPGHPERVAPPRPPGPPRADAPPVRYTEGIFVGYRWYDRQEIAPLFPFGHGLSYTRFEYTDLAVLPAGDGIDVAFTLRNAGRRKGADIAQVYLAPPGDAPAEMATKALAGFARVELDPGRSRRVTIHIGSRALSYWSEEKHDWVSGGRNRPVYVGASSRDIRLTRNTPDCAR